MTICNSRLDTPLHNAARWNHPALVNELLLYGARYSATNNDGKTPHQLTSDEQIKSLIWDAKNGIIAVGSYRPLKKPSDPKQHLNSVLPPLRGARGRGEGRSNTSSSRRDDSEEKEASHDLGVKSHDLGVKSGDAACESHDFVIIEVEQRGLGEQSIERSLEQEVIQLRDDESATDVSRGGEGLALQGEGLRTRRRVPPKRDEKLITLLQAIEAFDR